MRRRQPVPPSILKLRERVDTWRARRARLGPMPGALWSEAAALARQHGIQVVSREARLSYDSLKKRLASNEQQPATTAMLPAKPFIELPMAALGVSQGSEAAVIEMKDGRGRSLVVRMTPQALAQLPEVAGALWGLS